MIGLLGAKIWIENRVNFADPVNLVPLAAGITAGIGNLTIKVTSTFSISGIATGTLMVIIAYHAVRPFARRAPNEPQPGRGTGAVAAEDGAVRSPDEDTGSVAP
jgi:xanthine/uracil permease